MSRAFLKNDMKGSFGHQSETEEFGKYSVDFREVIVPEEWRREQERREVCQLKIDFHGAGAPSGGAQMFISLDEYDTEQLIPQIANAYEALLAWRKTHPPMKMCEDCNGTGCKDGKVHAKPLEKCQKCDGSGKVKA